MNSSKRYHAGHMEHSITERVSGMPTRNTSGGKCDVPRVSASSAGGTSAGMTAKKIPVAGRSNEQGKP